MDKSREHVTHSYTHTHYSFFLSAKGVTPFQVSFWPKLSSVGQMAAELLKN